jgi:hypothetical protein
LPSPPPSPPPTSRLKRTRCCSCGCCCCCCCCGCGCGCGCGCCCGGCCCCGCCCGCGGCCGCCCCGCCGCGASPASAGGQVGPAAARRSHDADEGRPAPGRTGACPAGAVSHGGRCGGTGTPVRASGRAAAECSEQAGGAPGASQLGFSGSGGGGPRLSDTCSGSTACWAGFASAGPARRAEVPRDSDSAVGASCRAMGPGATANSAGRAGSVGADTAAWRGSDGWAEIAVAGWAACSSALEGEGSSGTTCVGGRAGSADIFSVEMDGGGSALCSCGGAGDTPPLSPAPLSASPAVLRPPSSAEMNKGCETWSFLPSCKKERETNDVCCWGSCRVGRSLGVLLHVEKGSSNSSDRDVKKKFFHTVLEEEGTGSLRPYCRNSHRHHYDYAQMILQEHPWRKLANYVLCCSKFLKYPAVNHVPSF